MTETHEVPDAARSWPAGLSLLDSVSGSADNTDRRRPADQRSGCGLVRQASAGWMLVVLAGLAHGHEFHGEPHTLQRLEQQIERQQSEARRAIPLRPPAELSVPSQTQPDTTPTTRCRWVGKIIITNADRLPAIERKKLIDRYERHCLSSADLARLLAEMTRAYMDRGDITTRAYLPEQDLSAGTLRIEVIAGRIERFDVQGTHRPVIANTFPTHAGDVLNLRDLEQGLDQINTLGSNDAVLDLVPGSAPGQTVINVHNRAIGPPVHLFISGDNQGSDEAGRNNAGATLTLDGLLGLNESVSISLRRTVPDNALRRSSVQALQVSAPWGYSTLTAGAFEARHGSALLLPSGRTLSIGGHTTNYRLGVERVLHRGRSHHLMISGHLNRQASTSSSGGEKLDFASYNLTMASVETRLTARGMRSLGQVRLGYVQGLHMLGAQGDPAKLPEGHPNAQFGKLTAGAMFTRTWQPRQVLLTWESRVTAQYALDPLYGSQRFLVGGGNVGGFRNTAIGGDHGALWHNELSLPLGTWPHLAVHGRFRVGMGVGHVASRHAPSSGLTLAGAAMGYTLRWRTTALDFSVGRALHVPSLLTREATQLGMRLSFSL